MKDTLGQTAQGDAMNFDALAWSQRDTLHHRCDRHMMPPTGVLSPIDTAAIGHLVNEAPPLPVHHLSDRERLAGIGYAHGRRH